MGNKLCEVTVCLTGKREQRLQLPQCIDDKLRNYDLLYQMQNLSQVKSGKTSFSSFSSKEEIIGQTKWSSLSAVLCLKTKLKVLCGLMLAGNRLLL